MLLRKPPLRSAAGRPAGPRAQTTARSRACRVGWLVLALCSLTFPAAGRADPGVYEPGRDPALGVVLISWWNFGASGASVWEDAVQDVFDQGFRHVSISPLRFVQTRTGRIRLSDGASSGPETAHLAAALARARALGMSVTVNPFVETDGFAIWRGEMNFAGPTKTRFWSDYEAYLVEIAAVAQSHGAQRMTLGTELRAIVRDPAHNADWERVIAAVDAVFAGDVGYAANWDNYQDPNLTETIWEHPAVDFMGVDTFHPLATSAEAAGLGRPTVPVLEASWNSIFDAPSGGFQHGILAFASARKGGAGMPVVMTEHGTIPYDESTVEPFSSAASANPPDPDEQRNDLEALVRAADGRGARPASQGRLEAITLWHWGMPGADGSLWLLDPDGDDVTTGAAAARFLVRYVSRVAVPGLAPWGLGALAVLLGASGLGSAARPRPPAAPPFGKPGYRATTSSR